MGWSGVKDSVAGGQVGRILANSPARRRLLTSPQTLTFPWSPGSQVSARHMACFPRAWAPPSLPHPLPTLAFPPSLLHGSLFQLHGDWLTPGASREHLYADLPAAECTLPPSCRHPAVPQSHVGWGLPGGRGTGERLAPAVMPAAPTGQSSPS